MIRIGFGNIPYQNCSKEPPQNPILSTKQGPYITSGVRNSPNPILGIKAPTVPGSQMGTAQEMLSSDWGFCGVWYSFGNVQLDIIVDA